MKEVIIFRRDDTLDIITAQYYKDLLYRTLKVGTEIEVAPKKGVKRQIFEERIRQRLEPSGSLDNIGKWGVLDVQKEHCGIEIRVIGRHPYFHALYEQLSYIFGVIQSEGGRARPTCGMHFHIIPVGLSEPIPEIVLANLWNLTRRYAPYLKFITSCGDKMEALCRRRNHNSHREMIKHTPAVKTMREIKEALDKSLIVPKHQNFLNLQHLEFTEDGQVKNFHLEFRFPDADLSPLSVVTKIFLIFAMVLKSVEMSMYGVIHVGKYAEWKRKMELLDILNNNDGNLATSDTSRVNEEILAELKEGATELVTLLKSIFRRLEYNPTYPLLYDLASEPISLRRVRGLNWQEIEQELQKNMPKSEEPLSGKNDKKVMKIIEFQQVKNREGESDWKNTVADFLYLTKEELEESLMKISSYRNIEWDEQIGSFVFIG